MAGFASFDDLVSELTAGKTWRQDFTKVYAATNVYAAGVAAAGRSYDLSGYDQNQQAHGNYIYNGFMTAGLGGWTTSSANISWDAVNTAASKTGGASETLTQNTDCVNGTSYSVVYTIAGYTGSGNVVISLGGTNGTARTANGTYRETIACGATANAPLVVTFPTTLSAGRVDNIVVTRDLAFTPYRDDAKCREMGIWHGGDVSPDTKHLLNVGANANAATAAGAILHVVDLLGCYPRIQTNLATLQTLNNTLGLPRYADGKGVRAFFSLNAVNGANAQNFAMSYTNPASVAGRSLGGVVSNTASGVTGHMSHTGVATGNFGPWLPLGGGDSGILSVQSAQFSAASASAGFIDLVLCRPLTAIPITTAFVAAERDLLTQLPSLPRVYDGAVLGLIVQAGGIIASGNAWNGYLECGWG